MKTTVNKRVKKECRRCVAELLAGQFTSYSELADRVINIIGNPGMSSRKAYIEKLAKIVEECAHYGWWQTLCEAPIGKLTFPQTMNRAERWIALESIKMGMQVAIKQLDKAAVARN